MKQHVPEIVVGRTILPDGDGGIHLVRIRISGGAIAAVDVLTGADARNDLLAMPALANAHDHGRGLRPLCYGAFDQALETWFAALNIHPLIDAYANAAWAFARMAQSGIGLVVHCHMATNNPKLIDDAEAVCRAARDIGIRLAFVVPMRDRSRLGYFSDNRVLERVAAEDREAVRQRWFSPILPATEQLAIADEIARRCEGPLIDVLYGPGAPHWCTDNMLSLVADASLRTGRRVHMHCLETRYQREFADAAFPGGLFPFLDRIGFLSDRLTLAHGVYLRPDEMEMIASAGAIVSLNTCSNLRLRSGMAPAAEMHRHGVALGLGIDALGLDDEEDGLRELRLTHLLHAGVSFDSGLSSTALLEAALRAGARAVTGRPHHGMLSPGAPADIAVLDYASMTHDIMPGMISDRDLVLSRATKRYVRSLIVDGVEIMREGKVHGIDQVAVEGEVISQAMSVAKIYAEGKPLVERLQATLRQCYLEGLHLADAAVVDR
jgi:cytosine/adenosine deaminase-related metal-dependent hydrolase